MAMSSWQEFMAMYGPWVRDVQEVSQMVLALQDIAREEREMCTNACRGKSNKILEQK